MEKAPFAIVETGGKQLRVEPSQVIDIERVTAPNQDKEVVLEKVLLTAKGASVEIGSPYVKGAKVLCEYLGEIKAPKVVTFKIRRRKNYRRKTGHRQILTELRVKEIQVS